MTDLGHVLSTSETEIITVATTIGAILRRTTMHHRRQMGQKTMFTYR